MPITILAVFLSLIALSAEYVLTGGNSPVLQSTCILAISLIQIITSAGRQNFSIAIVHWFFVAIFFAIVPLVKLWFQVFPLVQINRQPIDLLVSTNYIILIWIVVFSLSYSSFSSELKVVASYFDPKVTQVNWGILISLFAVALYIISINPLGLFIRGEKLGSLFSSGTIRLIFQYFLRPMPFFLLVAYFFGRNYSGKARIIFYLSLVTLFLLYNGPIATARFYAFSMWLSVLGFYLFSKMKKGFVFLFVLAVGIFGSELVNGFRGGLKSGLNSTVHFGKEFWTSMNFDAYEMLASSISYVNEKGVLQGENVFGALAFFVPRVFWPDKPIGSGAFIMTEHYRFNSPYGGFSNVSCPLVAELFLAFGVFGVFFGAIFFGVGTKFLDSIYRNSYLNPTELDNSHIYNGYYFTLGGLFFFMMRGDLLSSFAFMTGISISFFVIMYLSKIKLEFFKIA